MATIRVGDMPLIEVTVIEDGVAVDVSGVGTKQIKLRAPNGTTTSYTASFATDGTDGKIQYQTDADDIGAAGTWYYSGRVVDGSSRVFETTRESLIVESAL